MKLIRTINIEGNTLFINPDHIAAVYFFKRDGVPLCHIGGGDLCVDVTEDEGERIIDLLTPHNKHYE